MNVSLIPWLLEFHTVLFSGSSACLLLLNWLLSFFLVLRGSKMFPPIPPSWQELPQFIVNTQSLLLLEDVNGKTLNINKVYILKSKL